MATLKDFFIEIDEENQGDTDSIEVYADSIKQALELAAEDLNIDIINLDYDIIEKGTKGIFGIGRQPYHVLITPLKTEEKYNDLDELENKLSGLHEPSLTGIDSGNVNSTFKIRVEKSGIMLTITPKKGNGKSITKSEIDNKLYSMQISNPNVKAVEKEIKKTSGKPVKIGDWAPNLDYDSSMSVEISEDEMKVFTHFIPPRFAGRHMGLDDVLSAMKSAGVVYGIKNEEIIAYLDEMNYSSPLLGASGNKPRHGNDAWVDYKVKIDRSDFKFVEDEEQEADFKNLNMIENVVVGQILALKVPHEEGVPGRTVTNKILPAKSGKDIKMAFGDGTILSEDGLELTAEINGQVIFQADKLSVKPLYVVNGDVSLESGNIIFLGSVLVLGSVQDNFQVKAAGNIEIKGTVQKSQIEAEGDIFIHQGISGREEAKIESTGGSIYAKFIQNATAIAESDIVVPEGILHSNVDAGEVIFCNGRRAKIAGGVVRAGEEINVRFLGADASTGTVVMCGINPKILQQLSELSENKSKALDEISQIELDLKTLVQQKKTSRRFSEEKEKKLQDLEKKTEKFNQRISEIDLELEELKEYMSMMENKGKICCEKTVYPGVEILLDEVIVDYYLDEKSKKEKVKDGKRIKTKFTVRDEYNYTKFTFEGGDIKLGEYELPEDTDRYTRVKKIGRRR